MSKGLPRPTVLVTRTHTNRPWRKSPTATGVKQPEPSPPQSTSWSKETIAPPRVQRLAALQKVQKPTGLPRENNQKRIFLYFLTI